MNAPLTDTFGREITYLRMSVTDRCDFRCVYCMAEEMTFLPRAQILTLEELAYIGEVFVDLGVKKIRLTGGEPLVRHNIGELIQRLGALQALDELVLTTNGSQLDRFAPLLRNAGVRRLNISLDSLAPETFKRLTRTGNLQTVLAGIDAASRVGFERIKINAVILKGRNDSEVLELLKFVLDRGYDISFIEEMPLGNISEHDRAEAFVSSQDLRNQIATKYELLPSSLNTGGPSRYWQIAGYDSKVGFISPHSENFCGSCNRVRLTVEGKLLLCLGNEHSVDLKEVVRAYPGDRERLADTLVAAIQIKPEKHEFKLAAAPQILRFMNATGG